MIAFDEAVRLVTEAARPLGRESVTLADAAERVLAAPVVAQVDSPPSDVSTMDGYAVRDSDLPGALRVMGESYPGAGFAGAVEPGTCVRIFTGAAVPAGADRVVIQETVTREADRAVIADPPGEMHHIRPKGSDFRRGDILLDAGRRLDPRALVAAAGADLGSVEVWRKPSILVLGTGDELVPPGEARGRPGAIPESLSVGIAALAARWGALSLGARRLADDLAPLEAAAGEALERADLVIVTGGASVGEKDFAKTMFEAHGLDLLFSKVAMKPGKPVWLGRARGRLVLGLPGNPTSAMVTARLLLAPLLAGLGGRDLSEALRWRRTTLIEGLPPTGERETFSRGIAEGEAVRVLPNQDSGAHKTLADCDLLVRLPAGAGPVAAGSSVDALDF